MDGEVVAAGYAVEKTCEKKMKYYYWKEACQPLYFAG